MNEQNVSELTLETPVGQWVAVYPGTSRVFQNHKIDFCCGGGKPVSEVCVRLNLDPAIILNELTSLISQDNATDETDWNSATLTELIENIVSTHHAFLKQELPRLDALSRKVAKVHGENHPHLIAILEAFLELQAELVPHMQKEEQILFPSIQLLETSKEAPLFPFGSVGNPIRMMEHEHENAGNALSRLRELTNDFQPPEGACNSYRALYAGLNDLETDTHLHVHKENNILFPKAKEIESSMA